LIKLTKGKHFQREETLYISFLTGMGNFTTMRDAVIDDISIEIENYEERSHPQKEDYSRILLPESFPNLEYLLENHKRLFAIDYYKFLGIESIDSHPVLKEIELEEEKEVRDVFTLGG
jgi:hypothetical protein